MYRLLALSGLIVGLAVLAAAGLVVAAAEEQSGKPETFITRLQPGDNLVGWTTDAAPVEALFEAIPQIGVVWVWDVEWRQWRLAAPNLPRSMWTLDQLKPGMGLRLRLIGDQTVDWERPRRPSQGSVTLKPGWNFVAWLGPDNAPVGRAVRGIGRTAESVGIWSTTTHEVQIFAPHTIESGGKVTELMFGDGLWVKVGRSVNWLQPTGSLPDIVLLGEVPFSVQDRLPSDMRSVLDFFAENFGIEADFADFSVLVVADLDSLLNHYRDGDDVDRDWQMQWARTLWGTAAGWVADDLVIVTEAWQRDSEGTPFVLPHEYFHIIQRQLGHHSLPVWLLEGTAQWAHLSYEKWERDRGARGKPPNDLWSAEIAEEFLGSAGCGRLPEDVAAWSYSEGTVATHQMVITNGTQSVIEFFRRLGGSANADWTSAFEATFELRVDAFVENVRGWVVDQWLEEVGSAPDLIPVAVHARRLDGAPVTNLQYHVLADATKHRCWSEHDVSPDDAGRAIVRFVTGVSSVLIGDMSEEGRFVGRFYYRNGTLIDGDDFVDPQGRISAFNAGEHLRFATGRNPSIEIVLHNDWWRWKISGRVANASGEVTNRIKVHLTDPRDHRQVTWARETNPDGTFAFLVPDAGTYILRVERLGTECNGYVRDDGGLGRRGEARKFEVAGGGVADILVMLPEQLCDS
ncbi:MAG: carboxypeptidase regulatory-like domain-containing protein [Chloroflexi bacterium]|nr:carboxypeptidase regulatory-like domain-containing protein [Chloroflexota bacterium]